MIRQVTIRGFKRFEEVRFTFSGHVVLAGPNNAGKTTILQAITAWDLALRRWRSLNDAAKHRGAYTKAPLARQAFTAVPLRTFDLLWRDRQLEHPIEIEVQSQTGWTLVMELLPDTTEQVYVRPRKDQDPTVVPRDGLQAVFVPPMTGVVIDEPLYANPEFINLRLSQARPGEVLRNILVEASQQEDPWRALTASIERLFGYRLLPPDAQGAHILSEYQVGTDGLRFDLASAGSGFQQVVMLLSHLHTRPGAVLLLDEPDAHLHLILQEGIYSELRSVAARQRSQLVIATHSEVVINTVQPEEIYVVLGTPRRLADGVDRQRLVAALQLLSNAEVMLAESAPGVLYVENFTDLGLLSEWARVLGHPARDRIAAAVHRFTGSGVRSTRHYDAIRLVREGLPGLELLDRDGNPNVPETEITGGGLQRLRRRRYEIESYLVHPDALTRFVSAQTGVSLPSVRPIVDDALRAQFTDLTLGFLASPLAPPPLVESYLRSTKARTEILPAILSSAGLPEFPYTRYAEIAAVMRPDEIHPEVVEKLDAIVRAFRGMSGFEVSEPILNSPFEEPAEHWRIVEGEEPQRVSGRRKSVYFYRGPGKGDGVSEGPGTQIELILVNRIRARVKAWREDKGEPYAGASRVSLELLQYWRREGRQHRLFYAQLEAAETIIFLTEARADLRQGLEVPLDEPSEDRRAEGHQAFRRLACKMATGSGKTTVMGMLSAWSILNKIAEPNHRAYSDVVLIVCPNVTIRSRLAELDPLQGDASLYRARDLVPQHLMPDLARGRVLVTNWHVFEPQGVQAMGVGARVLKAGRAVLQRETIHIGNKTTTAHGKRYVTLQDLDRQIAAGLVRVLREERDEQGELVRVQVEATRYLESDASLLRRVLGRQVGGKRNILVMNDEAHHAYRIRRPEPDEDEEELLGDEDEAEEFYKEATVWVDGLDRIHKQRGINACLDFSATPYFLGRVGQDSNRPFPWIVSDFNLTDAIESGLVKIPQLAVRDSSGAPVPGYFNIWRWIVERLTTAEKGGKRGAVKPEAVLKWAHAPIAMLGGDWDETLREWQEHAKEARPPVFIVVCKNTKIAKVLYEWLAEDKAPFGIPSSKLFGFRNEDAQVNTIRVDTKVVHETDTGQPKSDENAWMRFTLDTVGRREWPRDRQGREIHPEGFVELAEKLGRPLHPPGRDVRCIVSVGMLTEGWDCNTVTHIVGLRPFMSQLLCEQVVGRGLRRTSYEVGDNGLLTEEVAKVLGVPFEIIPFKASKTTGPRPVVERKHVHAMPSRAEFEIRFPRVEGYRQAIRNRVRVSWEAVPNLFLDPTKIPDEVEMKALLPANESRPTLLGPGKLESVTLNPFRQQVRLQELEFQLAKDLCREYQKVQGDSPPAHVLFPQFAAITHRFLRDHVRPMGGADVRDAFLSPYYGWVLERLGQALSPDAGAGEIPELPRYEQNRPEGTTAEVDFWTSRDVREVRKSHLNFVVADTKRWEQQAACFLDRHDRVECFVKNASLGFAIPYLENGQPHDFVPDFIVRLKPSKAGAAPTHLILETKGYDPRKDAKEAAANRWVAAVNADARYGLWSFAMTDKPAEVPPILDRTW